MSQKQRKIQNYQKMCYPQYAFQPKNFSFDRDDVKNSNKILAQIFENGDLKSRDFSQRILVDYRHREQGKN